MKQAAGVLTDEEFRREKEKLLNNY